MKIAIIYGSPRKGITYQTVQIIKDEMRKNGPVEFTEFHLPQDMPAFCKGCFQCFLKGEDKCPDAKYVQPIVAAMMEADGFIISTPVYAMQISGGLKAFFDHMAYCYLNHRPRFFRQKALVVVTTAGAGMKNCLKYIAENLSFWGVNKAYTLGEQMLAAEWNGVPPKVMEKVNQRCTKLAGVFYHDLASHKVYSPSFLQTIMFYISRLLMHSYKPCPDRNYWQEQGWLDQSNGYFLKQAKPGFLKSSVAQFVSFFFKKMVIVHIK